MQISNLRYSQATDHDIRNNDVIVGVAVLPNLKRYFFLRATWKLGKIQGVWSVQYIQFGFCMQMCGVGIILTPPSLGRVKLIECVIFNWILVSYYSERIFSTLLPVFIFREASRLLAVYYTCIRPPQINCIYFYNFI